MSTQSLRKRQLTTSTSPRGVDADCSSRALVEREPTPRHAQRWMTHHSDELPPQMQVGLRRTDRRRYTDIGCRTSDLTALNYGLEVPPSAGAMAGELMGEGDGVPTIHEGRKSAERRNEVNCDVRTTTASDPHSERPEDDQASDLELKDSQASDLAHPEVTSSVTAQNRFPETPPEVVQKNESGARNQICETAETENRKVAEQIGNRGDDAGQPGSLPADVVEAEDEVQAADDEDEHLEDDLFEQLPPRAPYQDPPVFRGHNNYGFEFFPSWGDVDDDRPERQSGNESESDRSSHEDD